MATTTSTRVSLERLVILSIIVCEVSIADLNMAHLVSNFRQLPTLIALTFLASLISAMNFTSRQAYFSRGNLRGNDGGYGWPEFAYYNDDHHTANWDWSGFGTDAAVFLGTLVAAAAWGEFIVRAPILIRFRQLIWPPHICTALIAATLLAFIFWLNVTPRYANVGSYPKLHACWHATVDGPGWPIAVKSEGYAAGTFEAIAADYNRELRWSAVLGERAKQWPLFVDAAVAGIFILAVCCPIQWLIRRREAGA